MQNSYRGNLDRLNNIENKSGVRINLEKTVIQEINRNQDTSRIEIKTVKISRYAFISR